MLEHSDAMSAERAILAARSHAFGKSWVEVAKETGHPSADAARKAAYRVMKRNEAKDVDEIRRYINNRLETWLALLEPEIRALNLWAFDRALAITEQQRKLYGVDTPVLAAKEQAAPPVVIEVQTGVWAAI